MSTHLIYALHGYLGCAADWDVLKSLLPDFEFIAEDLFSEKPELGIESLLEKLGSKIFIGYSLGGRLGLKILDKYPQLFDHFIFLSTNPGLAKDNFAAREARLQSDKLWSAKISPENWSSFLEEWNRQSVFAGSTQEPQRLLESYNLTKLKDALSNWSLSAQPDYSSLIRKYRHKITWVVGDRDSKFCALAEELKNKKILSGYERISSGHRIWLDHPQAVADIIKQIS